MSVSARRAERVWPEASFTARCGPRRNQLQTGRPRQSKAHSVDALCCTKGEGEAEVPPPPLLAGPNLWGRIERGAIKRGTSFWRVREKVLIDLGMGPTSRAASGMLRQCGAREARASRSPRGDRGPCCRRKSQSRDSTCTCPCLCRKCPCRSTRRKRWFPCATRRT